jgi:hypothetical protein
MTIKDLVEIGLRFQQINEAIFDGLLTEKEVMEDKGFLSLINFSLNGNGYPKGFIPASYYIKRTLLHGIIKKNSILSRDEVLTKFDSLMELRNQRRWKKKKEKIASRG